MNPLAQYDSELFLLFNRLPHPDIAVRAAYILSGWQTFWLLWFVIGIILFVREERRDHGFIFPFASAGILSWVVSDILLKQVIARLRPPYVLGAVTIFGKLPFGYSFPSTHSTLAFALATVLAWKEPKWFWGLYVLASLVALSRVYLGYHFPIDIIGGALLGWGIGWLAIGIHEAIDRRMPFRRL